MNVELNEISAVKQEITAKFEWDEVKDIYNNTVRELKQDFRMNGFRPGKVPTNLLKKQIGPKIKYQTLNRIFREYNDDVFEEAGVKMDELLDYSITDVEFEENKPFSYKIEIEMDPEVEVFDYKEGFSLKKKEYEV